MVNKSSHTRWSIDKKLKSKEFDKIKDKLKVLTKSKLLEHKQLSKQLIQYYQIITKHSSLKLCDSITNIYYFNWLLICNSLHNSQRKNYQGNKYQSTNVMDKLNNGQILENLQHYQPSHQIRNHKLQVTFKNDYIEDNDEKYQMTKLFSNQLLYSYSYNQLSLSLQVTLLYLMGILNLNIDMASQVKSQTFLQKQAKINLICKFQLSQKYEKIHHKNSENQILGNV